MTMNGYRQLFAVREFSALWTASAMSVAATTMSSLVLGTLAYSTTGSPLLAAVTMFGPSLVQVVGASTLMSAADTARPRTVLILVAAVLTATLVFQAALDLGTGARLAVLLVAAYMLSIGAGVRWGLLAEILPEGQFALARSAMNVSVGAMQVVGFAVGGALMTLMTARHVLWLSALLAALALLTTATAIADRDPRRPHRTGIASTWRANQRLLANGRSRTLVLALCLPNGFVAGCEALFVPYAGSSAALLFVAAAIGMLAGDVVVGRALTPGLRARAATWLRFWLAVPFSCSWPSLPRWWRLFWPGSPVWGMRRPWRNRSSWCG